MKKNFVLLVFSAVFLAGCSGARRLNNGAPACGDGLDISKYPRQQYLTGTGAGADLEEARKRAVSQIAAVFNTQIITDSRLFEVEEIETKGGNTGLRDTAERIVVKTEKLLTGVETDTCFDKNSNNYSVIAFLERAKTAELLKERLDEIDKEITALERDFTNAGSKVKKAQTALKILSLYEERRREKQDIAIVSWETKRPAQLEYKLLADARKAISDVNMSVEIEGGESLETDFFRASVVGALNSIGFQTLSDDKAKAEISVKIKLDIEKPAGPFNTPWKWCRATATISAVNREDGKEFLSFNLSEKEAAREYQNAYQRAITALSDKTAKKIKDGFLNLP